MTVRDVSAGDTMYRLRISDMRTFNLHKSYTVRTRSMDTKPVTVEKTGRKWATADGTRYRAVNPEGRYLIAEDGQSALFALELDMDMAMDRWCRIPEGLQL